MADNHDTLDFFGRLENRLALTSTMLDAQMDRLDRLAPADPVPAELCNEISALRVDVATVVDELRKLARHVAAVEALTLPAAALAQQMQADARTTANVVADPRPAGWHWRAGDGLRRVGVPDDVQAPRPDSQMDPHAEALANALRTAGRPDLAERETERLRQRVLASGDLLGYQAGQVSRAELDAQRAAAPAVDLSALPGLRDMAEDLAAHLESRWGSDENAMQATELAHGLRLLMAGRPDPRPSIPAQLMELRRQGRLVDAQELAGSDLLEMAELQARALARLASAPALVSLDVLDEISARGQAMLGRLRQLVDTDARAAQTPAFMVLGPLGLIR